MPVRISRKHYRHNRGRARGPDGRRHELSAAGRPVVVVEQDREHVGGIARTVNYKGFRFDIAVTDSSSKNAESNSYGATSWATACWSASALAHLLSRPVFQIPLET